VYVIDDSATYVEVSGRPINFREKDHLYQRIHVCIRPEPFLIAFDHAMCRIIARVPPPYIWIFRPSYVHTHASEVRGVIYRIYRTWQLMHSVYPVVPQISAYVTMM
jgi:hypothetical protein